MSRISAAVMRAWRRTMLPAGAAACNVCGFVARDEHPRMCPGCGTYQRQRSFKQLFLERLQAEVFGSGPLDDGLLLSPGKVERALLIPQLRRPIISSLYQKYSGIDSLIRADMRDLAPFSDGSFDYVQACNVLDYVPEMGQALRAVHRALRSGGLFVFLIPEENLMDGTEPISVSIRRSVTGNYWPDPEQVPFVRVGRKTLWNMLAQAGFEPEEVRLREPLSRLQHTWWLCRRR